MSLKRSVAVIGINVLVCGLLYSTPDSPLRIIFDGMLLQEYQPDFMPVLLPPIFVDQLD